MNADGVLRGDGCSRFPSSRHSIEYVSEGVYASSIGSGDEMDRVLTQRYKARVGKLTTAPSLGVSLSTDHDPLAFFSLESASNLEEHKFGMETVPIVPTKETKNMADYSCENTMSRFISVARPVLFQFYR